MKPQEHNLELIQPNNFHWQEFENNSEIEIGFYVRCSSEVKVLIMDSGNYNKYSTNENFKPYAEVVTKIKTELEIKAKIDPVNVFLVIENNTDQSVAVCYTLIK